MVPLSAKENKLITYNMHQTVQNLKKKGVPTGEIHRQTGLAEKTILKYQEMSPEEFLQYRNSCCAKSAAFEPLQVDILECYERAGSRKLHVSSVFDYLEEKHEQLPGTERSLRNFIKRLEKTGVLVIGKSSRRYSKVPELPKGQQIQLDFGQWKLPSGLKLYLFAAVLSSSRFKVIYCQDRPFQTIDVIRNLLSVFREIGGIPKELVIDQDRLMVVSENAGDIVYTKEFASFIQEQHLEMFVCRKADPETKGKVENLVGFIKKNFLNTRDFTCIDDAQMSLRKWLSRRANGKRSAATGVIPSVAIEEERDHLRALKPSIFESEETAERKLCDVNKFGQISISGRKYEVPSEYRRKSILAIETIERVVFLDPDTHKQVGASAIPLFGSSGRLISTHKDPSKTLVELQKFADEAYPLKIWKDFLRLNYRKYPRYIRDQLATFKKGIHEVFSKEVLQKSLEYCIDFNTVSMADLVDTCKHFHELSVKAKPEVLSPLSAISKGVVTVPKITVATRKPEFYAQAIVSSGVGA